MVVVGELIVAVSAVFIVLGLTRAMAHLDAVRLTDLTAVLALCAAAAGATTAILSRMTGQLRPDPRGRWLCLALLLYTVVAIPAATIGATARWDEAAVGNVRLFAHAAFVALLYLIAWAPGMPRWLSVGTALLGLLSVAAALGGLGEAYPSSCLAVTTAPALRWGLNGFWVAAPLTLIATALRQRAATLYRVGLALEIIAVAHALRVAQGSPAAPFDLSFSLMRLLGIVGLLWVTVGTTRTWLASVDRAHDEQQTTLQQTLMKLARARERDHELRNGLAGLAGATKYLHTSDAQSGALRHAVAAELTRLTTMMRIAHDAATATATAEPGQPPTPQRYSIEEVLADQVTLRQSTGMDIRLDTDPRLRATGSAAALAQVVSNLLANCERHAPGSPVRIQARDTGSTVRIRVTDFGPGIPAGTEHTMFGLGARGADSPGQGIGLHLSDRLLHQDQGSITIAPTRPARPGTTVIIELPSAADSVRTP
jgi:two-component system OmpR family sensor kinase